MSYPAASAGHVLLLQQIGGLFLIAAESDDTLVSAMAKAIRVDVAVIEANDTLSAIIFKPMRAALAVTEAADTLSASFTKSDAAVPPEILGFDGDQPSTAATTNFTFAGMPSTAIPGDKMLIALTRGGDVPALDIPAGSVTTATLIGWLTRPSSDQESNYTVGFYEMTLAAGDITAGKPNVVIATLPGNQFAAALLLRGVGSIQYSMTPMLSGSTATSGFNRTAAGAANSIASVAMTPSGASGQIAVNWMMRGGGLRDVTVPSSWTLLGEAENDGSGLSRRAVAIATKAASVGVSTGVANWAVAGAADLTLTALTTLLKP